MLRFRVMVSFRIMLRVRDRVRVGVMVRKVEAQSTWIGGRSVSCSMRGSLVACLPVSRDLNQLGLGKFASLTRLNTLKTA